MPDVLAILLAIAAAVGFGLVAAEVKGWGVVAARAIVRAAARTIPSNHTERYREEWLAEVEAYADRPVTSFAYATRVLLRSRALSAELAAMTSDRQGRNQEESPRALLSEPAPDRRLLWELGGGPYAVTAARLALSDLHEHLEEAAAFDVRLLVSELITNAVRHARVTSNEPISLSVEIWAEKVRVCVDDHKQGFEPVNSEAPKREGWGLFFVTQLSEQWGVSSGRVWFEIDR